MKILMGTPVNEVKDYSTEKWIASISKLDYPFDLLMVDNSAHVSYLNKIHGYCKKYGLTNYKIVHIGINPDSTLDEKLARSREIIRREVIEKNYDAWFSLECDVIAPKDSLTKLVSLIGDNWMINHAYPSRDNPEGFSKELGLSLIARKTLQKIGFINEYGYIDSLLPKSWYGSDVWFIRKIDRKSKGKRINIYGIIRPIYHLAK